ncbi:MAG TPA: tetratricopeptide repeat protein, partial [Ignavibacteriales bacterium]|nr:tetratricopeptide repeat protein [Ignavibacteriales bacterium]
ELRHNIGMLYLEKREYEKASKEFGNAILVAIKGNYPTVLTISYLGKANALLKLNALEDSYEYCYKALEIAIRIEDKLTIADVYRVIGTIERKLKHYNAAVMYLDISLQMNLRTENKLNTAETSLELALMYDETGDAQEKINCLNKAQQYYTEINAVEKVKLIDELLEPALNRQN